MSSVCTEFKEIVEALQKDNEELREIIAQQDAKLERAMFAIYNLHGGLYNQRTQAYMLELGNALLLGKEKPVELVESVNIWPTTRQGDAHEERISKLEDTVEFLQKQIIRLEQKMKVN